jgi:hypothetical protein
MSEASLIAAFAALPDVEYVETTPLDPPYTPLGEAGKFYACVLFIPPSRVPQVAQRIGYYIPDRIAADDANQQELVDNMVNLFSIYKP